MAPVSSANFFSLFYILFSLGFLLQSREFIGAGLTPSNILSRWLETDQNSENIQFIQHHIGLAKLIILIGYDYRLTVLHWDCLQIKPILIWCQQLNLKSLFWLIKHLLRYLRWLENPTNQNDIFLKANAREIVAQLYLKEREVHKLNLLSNCL